MYVKPVLKLLTESEVISVETFEELLAANNDPLERFVKYKIGSAADADDVLQETRVAAFESFGALKDKSVFKAWLIGIARHKCADYCRERAKRTEIPLDSLRESRLVTGERFVHWYDCITDHVL